MPSNDGSFTLGNLNPAEDHVSTHMADFIVQLATDSGLLSDYEKDPTQVLARSGLSAEEVAILKRRDPHAVRIYLKGPADRQIGGMPQSGKKKKKKVKK
jgi:hypothetical protein